METIIRCTDLETTGLKPPEAAVCEIGWTDVIVPDDGAPRIEETQSMLVSPGHQIPPEISAVHHITNEDVESAPVFSQAAAGLLVNGDRVVLCAHNAKFEQQFITMPARWICSYKVALHLAPNAPAHNLQTLRYWLKLNLDRDKASPPHRAGPDTYVTAHLVVRMLAKLSVTKMIEISSRPAMLPRFHFGKHVGVPLKDVPTDYLEWVVSPKGITDDEDVLFTARHWLNLRRA